MTLCSREGVGFSSGRTEEHGGPGDVENTHEFSLKVIFREPLLDTYKHDRMSYLTSY